MSFKNLITDWFWRLINLVNLLFVWRFARNVMSLTNTKQLELEFEDCEYDSTWDEEIEAVKKEKAKVDKRSRRNLYAARDMQEYRHSCQNLDDDDDDDQTDETYSNMQDAGRMQTSQKVFYNLQFYKGYRKSEPDNEYISAFHDEWKGKYGKLERVHSYIQWLFPIQERGLNWQAYVLTKEEIKRFREDDVAKLNFLKSYELMLDFYGISLVNKNTGDVARAVNWRERFDNLNRNTHNNLRITRILKCLGTLGFEHYQEKLVKFFLHETLVEKNLPNVKESVLDYFMFAVLSRSQRKDLVMFAFENFEPKEDFVWGLKKMSADKHGKNYRKISTDFKAVASGEHKTLDAGLSRKQEKGGAASSPTSYSAEYTRDRNEQESVLRLNKVPHDHAENKSVSSGKKQERQGTPNTTKDAAGGTRKDSSKQESVFSQSNLKDQDVTGMKNITVEQSGTKNGQPQSKMSSEETSNESEETSQDMNEIRQFSSNSAPDEAGCYSHVQQHESCKLSIKN